ncbi:response regulator [Rhizobium sp. S-51]|uniref:Response regulator n=1 Tax=Rhizobium terricola TaxID=2728849 RepID=A0A7Y0AZB6_9HYPH|nr:HD domain-containing phosphohydrolase [Rhizobium terricola]NML76115.1 response regulator [Rhizobium terricola]
MRVIAIDDSAAVLALLRHIVGQIDDCDVRTFLKPEEALDHVARETPDLVLVDYTMPVLNGVDVIRRIRSRPSTADVPIIMITSERENVIKIAAIEAGATEFLGKPFDAAELTLRVRNQLNLRRAQRALAERAQSLERDVEAGLKRIESQEKEIIWRLSKAIGCRDGETGSHLERVAAVAQLIAEELGLGEERSRIIYLASPLHDVGKIGVRDGVLLKPGTFTPEERLEMQRHTEYGAEILSGSQSELIRTAERIAASHHEKWDGTGYPKGLTGPVIPLEARIVAVADVFDALSSERPYKPAWPLEIARHEIVNGSGKHFDPACVEAFCNRWDQIRRLYLSDRLEGTSSPAAAGPDESSTEEQIQMRRYASN